ncbi:MAG: glycosyltransferase family 4 protein [Planctomycetes bacterium]|nr:glycosyltransferase family 4 protein [Planctomycetota bacterium]
MRIGITFHTTDEFISGVQYYTLGLINALLRIDAGNEYFVFTNQSRVAQKNLVKAENLRIVNCDRLDNRCKRILWEHFRLGRLAEKMAIDVLHCPAYICPAFGCKVPVVLTVHDSIAIDHRQFCTAANAAYFNLFMPVSVRNADKVVAVSKVTAKSIREHFKIDNGKLKTVRPGVDNIFTYYADKWVLKQAVLKYNLPRKYILFVGNIEPKKNIDTLLKAYKKLKEKGLRHKLVIVGGRSWKSSDLRRKIREDFNQGDIILTGYVDRDMLASIYQMADVFVSVSLCEGFGFCPLEAMACGCCVVACKTGILEEISDDAFYAVEAHDAEMIAEGIFATINNKNLRKRLVLSGLRQARKFDWDRCAEKMLRVYKEVAG